MVKIPEKPATFILGLAQQAQLLACLKWLSDFQVLACIPLGDKISFTNAANLLSIPAKELCRVVRMTATAGILYEPEPGFVAHTPLSAHFITKPSLLDATAFLADTAAPAALRMADATRLRQNPRQAHLSAYGLASNSSTSFAAQCEHEPKLRRQLVAFRRLEASIADEGVANAFSSLDWRSLGRAKVVEVGAQSTTATVALCEREPGLRFVIQMQNDCLGESSLAGKTADTASRITIQHRTPGAPQNVDDAAVYILHLPSPSLSTPSTSLVARITAELRAHFNILRVNSNATLMLLVRLLPEPGTVDADVEAFARMHDLWLLQIANEQVLETSQLLEILDTVRDGTGRLVVVNRLASQRHFIVALEVQIRPLSDQRGHQLT